MQFTDEEISKQEDYVNVLKYKAEIDYNELLEAQRTYYKSQEDVNRAESKLETMLRTS